MTRVGVIGLGTWGPKHAATLFGLPEADLVAVVDTDPARLAALDGGPLADIPRYDDVTRALDESGAEAWVVASPTATHVPFAKEILGRGLSVLLEKPIASTLAEAETLAPFVKEDSSNILLGHSYVYGSEFLELQAAVKARGAPTFIDCIRHRPLFLRDRFSGESPFHLLMVHDLYLLIALLGRKDPVEYSAQVHRGPTGGHDVTLAQLRFEDGLLVSLTASFITPDGMPGDGYDRMEVYGEGWAVRIEPNPRPIEVYDDKKTWPLELELRPDPAAPTGLLAEAQRRFLRVIRGEAEVPVGPSFHDAMRVQRWLERLVESANG